MDGGPTELFHLEGEGNTVALRVHGTCPGTVDLLDGELRINTTFVAGTLPIWLTKDTLKSWRDTLDVLDTGDDAVWDTGDRGPVVSFEHGDFGRLAVTVADPEASLVTVTVPTRLYDDWFDDAYDRLDRVWRTWFGAA